MSCFSGPIDDVAGTKIFARVEAGWQYLVYEMTFESEADLAVVLPLPVARDGEACVRFLDMGGYADFFDDLNRLFPFFRGGHTSVLAIGMLPPPTLPVHRVGAFEASFVPTLGDFDRLDRRFSLSPETLEQLPDYGDFGFAVFKLAGRGRQQSHPMALSFRTRDADVIFFPTLHLRDGKVAQQTRFDHHLYCQAQGRVASDEGRSWLASQGPVGKTVDIGRTHGIVDEWAPCYRLELKGEQRNRDVRVPNAA